MYVSSLLLETGYLYAPANIGSLFVPGHQAGARIHNGSWGSNGNGAYTSYASGIDTYAEDNPHDLLVFAAGNDGTTSQSDQAAAKNVISGE